MAATRKRPPATRPAEQAAVLTLSDLEQVRVLSDPLRVRLIEHFCRGECTTKQVAEALGEKPTRLYHHVDALERVGLIRQTRTRRNRGTLERYYVSVARSFRADSTLFRADEPGAGAGAVRSAIATILGNTADELGRLAAIDDGAAEVTDRGVLSYLEICADARTMARIERRVKKLVEDLQALGIDAEADAANRRYRLTLAFYPLDRYPEP